MAAYDNVSLPAPPNIATAGNYAQMLMQGLSALGSDYQSGKNFQYQQRNQNLFQGGIPQNAQGQPDFYAMLQKMIQAGGAPAAGQVLPMLQKQPFFDVAQKQAQKDFDQDNGAGANTGPAASPAAAGPANITGQTGQAKTAATNGGDTVNSLAGDHNVDLDAFLARYPGVRGLLNRDLTPQQAKAVAQRMADFKQGGGGQVVANEGGGLVSDEGGTNQGTPTGIGGSSPISPAPTAASGGGASAGQPQVTAGARQWQPAASFDQRFSAATGGQGGASNMVPGGVDPLAYAQALKKRAEALRRQSNTQGIIGIPTKAKEDQALALDKQADAILEQLGKAGELTDLEKATRASGVRTPVEYEAQKEQAGLDRKRGDALYKGIQASYRAEADMREHRQAMKGIINDPNFTPGTGYELTTGLQKFRASVPSWMPGYDPNASTANEAIRKVTAQNILNQTDQLKAEAGEMGGSQGRLFQQQIELMHEAAQRGDSSKSALRYLTELGDRTGAHIEGVSALATQYKRAHGYLDDGFDDVLRQYNRDHPMFTQDEMRDLAKIAPPEAPKLDTKEQATAWARREGVREGDWIKLPSGDVIRMHFPN